MNENTSPPRNRLRADAHDPVGRTISQDYRHQQKLLHANPSYGTTCVLHAPVVKQILAHFGMTSICDYGAGKALLKSALTDLGCTGFDYFPYDPAFPEYGAPKPADFVCCIDVMEHIEEEFVPQVLAELRALTLRYALVTIATSPAMKTLPDGRNAHITVRPAEWWEPQIKTHFDIVRAGPQNDGFWVLLKPKSP